MRFVKAFVARQKVGLIDSYNAILTVIPEINLAVSVLLNSFFAFPNGVSTCFKIADLIHSTLLPALNKTLFELESTASFPINPKPFLGDYLVYQINSITGKELIFKLTVDSHKGSLVGMVEKNTTVDLPAFNPSIGFVLKYIDQPLVFQASPISGSNVNGPCLMSHWGFLSIVTFDSPGFSGLANGFSAPAWKIIGKRIIESDS
jgi:hypothetical protein